LLKSQFTDHEQPIDIRVPHRIIDATLVQQERAMPIEQIPDADLRYYLVAFDGEGRERTDDPAGLMSENVISALQEQPITDVFVMSHGWRADVPSAKRQYAAWIGAMLACTDDLARMRTTRPDFRPLLLGLHWPSEPFGTEERGVSSTNVMLQRLRTIGVSSNRGPGIRNQGDTLTMKDCAITGNDGLGIANGGAAARLF